MNQATVRLTAEFIGGVKCQCCAAANEIESLRAIISRLREYASHAPNCVSFDRPSWAHVCDCGYDELRKELEEST